MEEAVLLQGPVRTMCGRLASLMLEYPEHPLLLQLDAICERLLGVNTHHSGTSDGATFTDINSYVVALQGLLLT